MSYTYKWQAENYQNLFGENCNCGVSGKKIFNGDKVLDMKPEILQRYGKFLSEQQGIRRLIGTPIIGTILDYLVNGKAVVALVKFADINQTTRSGRITKKPLRHSDQKFVPGGSNAVIVDQYDRGFDRGSFHDSEKWSHDLKRKNDEIYNDGDIVDDDEPIETFDSSGEEEAEWQSDDEENSDSDWISSEMEGEDDGGSEDDYDAYNDGV